MKHRLRYFAILALVFSMVITACDYDTGDKAGYGATLPMNVSGVYQLTGGGLIVTTFSQGDAEERKEKVLGIGDDVTTGFRGEVTDAVTPGSVQVVAHVTTLEEEFFTDTQGTSPNMASNLGGQGNVKYDTGEIAVTFGVPPLLDEEVVMSYRARGTLQGSTHPISQFMVDHLGGTIRLVDSNGDVFDGEIYEAVEGSDEVVPVGSTEVDKQGNPVELQRTLTQAYPFSVAGTSQGIGVQIVGTIQATIIAYYVQTIEGSASGSIAVKYELLTNVTSLSMNGTWIEDNGRTADVNAIGPSDKTMALFGTTFTSISW